MARKKFASRFVAIEKTFLFVLCSLMLSAISPVLRATTAPDKSPCYLLHAGALLDQPGQAPRKASSVLVCAQTVVAIKDGFVSGDQFASVATDIEIINLRDYFVLPGLIDSHVHLASDTAGVQGQLESVTLNVADVAYNAAVNARKTLMAGFTTVRNLGDANGVTLALRDAINAGKVIGPRIIDAGTSISTTAGHMDPTLGFRENLHAALDTHENLCDGVDACRRAVRQQIGRGVDVIKIATTGGVNSRIGAGIGQQMFEDEARAIVDTAHLYKKKVAVHAHAAEGIKIALRAGADSIEHGTLIDADSLKLFQQSGAYYVPTLSTVNGYIERLKNNPDSYSKAVREKIEWRIKVTGESLRKAVPAGVKIAFGTDAGVSLHGRNADEFELMVKYGMTPAAAIHAATINAAALLGVGEQVGSIEANKKADLIAVKNNPLVDIENLKQIDFVMKDGQVIKSF